MKADQPSLAVGIAQQEGWNVLPFRNGCGRVWTGTPVEQAAPAEVDVEEVDSEAVWLAVAARKLLLGSLHWSRLLPESKLLFYQQLFPDVGSFS